MKGIYKPEDKLQTPYDRAKHVWDQRIGSSRQQAANWRLVAFCLIAVVLVLSTGLVYLSSQAQVVPYVVEVEASGRPREPVRVAPGNYTMTQAAAHYFIGTFITQVRSLSSDPVVAKRNWLQAYNLVSQKGATMLTGYLRQHDPTQELGQKTRSVHVDMILPLSPNTFQSEWTEQEHHKNGHMTSTKKYQGVFTMLHRLPTTQQELQKNPLGVYIDHFSVSPKISGGQT
ncbi:MAG: conjugal transfer protein TrbF [Myxococcota bacterium]